MTQEIVDAPTNEMHTDAFIEVLFCGLRQRGCHWLSLLQKIREVGDKLGLDPPVVIQGKELEEKGFGG